MSDKESLNKLPRLKSFTRDATNFCFSNQEFSINSFKKLNKIGTTTIYISDYVYNLAPVGTIDYAFLKKTIK